MFVYSPRSGTKAAERLDSIPENIKSARIKELVSLQRKIGVLKAKEQIGKTHRTLIDGIENGFFTATTDNGRVVYIPCDASVSEQDFVGKFKAVKILESKSSRLYGVFS
jgi:tRNA-2-methylthio-N6-dimethylallyladenosine synthase